MLKFFRKLYTRTLVFIMSTRFYYFLVMNFIPFVRFSTYYTAFRGFQFKRSYPLLKKGDFVVVHDPNKLTSLLIPGMWDHVGIVVSTDTNDEWEISEMTHQHYTKSCYYDMCAQADRVAIYRCTTFDDDYINNVVVPKAKALDGALYDVTFDGASIPPEKLKEMLPLGVPPLYCSELVYQADPERRMGVDLSDLIGMGRPYISPDGLTKAKNVVCIWDSKYDNKGLRN